MFVPRCCTRLPVPVCCREQDPKRVYYMSMEFLMGRSLLNTLYNLGIKDQYAGQQQGRWAAGGLHCA